MNGEGDPLGSVQKLKFDHTLKWYRHKLESVLKNERHKILWDFVTQPNHLIPAKRSDIVIINKKKKKKKKEKKDNLQNSGLWRPGEQQNENKRKRKERQVLDLAKKLKRLWNMKVMAIPIIIGAFGTVTKGLTTGLEEMEIGKRTDTHPKFATNAGVKNSNEWRLSKLQLY